VFRKQVNPKAAAIMTLLTLGAIQWIYWRNLVYQPLPTGGGPMNAAPPPPRPPLAALGLETVRVENWVGDQPGFADGPSWAARFAGPNALAIEADGSLLVADSRNHCIRRISPRGTVTTVAGGGTDGSGGAAVGPAASARFRYPSGVAAGKDGAIYIADTGNQRICSMQNAQVEVLAGGATGLADGVGAAARFNGPAALGVDHEGALWVWDTGNAKLRRIDCQGKVSTPPAAPQEISATLGMAARKAPEVVSSAVDGEGPIGPSAYRSGLRSGAAQLPAGAQIFGDLTHHVVFVQRPGEPPLLIAGRIVTNNTVISDVEGVGNRAGFATPAAVAARADGTVYVADYDGNRIRRLRLPQTLLQ
jgi:sugar lactone lactonase YvrE